jgi:Secretion system C-terminal sorting domain
MRFTILLALVLVGTGLAAQCAFNPTILPGDTVACPKSVVTFSTQTYESYQWYKRPYGQNTPATPIQGATQSTYQADTDAEGVHFFSVDATQNGCTERSPEVLLDVWAFIPITVLTTGEFTISPIGETEICHGDSAWFVLLGPYANAQWYYNGSPIPGATDDSLLITQPGIYNVSAVPGLCTNLEPEFGLDLGVIWSSAPGCTVSVDDPAQALPGLVVTPNPAQNSLTVTLPDAQTATCRLMDLAGRIVIDNQFFTGNTTLATAALPAGIYTLLVQSGQRQAVEKVVIHH